jgi:hypothetical protein
MFKSLGVVLAGVFVGAVGMEVIHKKYPHAFDKLFARAREVASGATEAFRAGYENVARPQEAVGPSA